MMKKELCDIHLTSCWLNTPLGSMLAISDQQTLYFLEFADQKGLNNKLFSLRKQIFSTITEGYAPPIVSIENELKQYFSGVLQSFTTPIHLFGSSFRQTVWNELKKIPFGTTKSYANLAEAIDKPTACRAVAQANGANQLAIIIPCHRVINSNGDLGGYAGGISRKKWLLDHEKNMR